jgi:hypothetical protein
MSDNPPHIGFTGTQRGMTTLQINRVRRRLNMILEHSGPFVAHHGDCIGADAEFHDLVRELGVCTIVVHPPKDPKKRAFKEGDLIREEAPYLVRNMDMVRECQLGLAAPHDHVFPGATNLRGHGTWSTWYKYVKADKLVIAFLPDGRELFQNYVPGYGT